MTHYDQERVSLPGEPEDVYLTRFAAADAASDSGAKKTPVIICPGGGYRLIGTSEGEPVAARLLDAGYAPFVLHYSVGESVRYEKEARPPVKSAADLGKAALLIAARADAWHVNPQTLVLAGFSAGGHVTATYLGEAVRAGSGLPVPQAALLVYPLMVRDGPPDGGPASYDAKLGIAAGWPPTFLYHCTADRMVPFESSVLLDAALTKAGVPHMFFRTDTGTHARPFEPGDWWQPFVNWLDT
ncbi:MAG: alpha/beta hydrolase [Clostridiales Family XIII bacterium]|jgi:acetyl esterase/lipase|nr:alpha/beta hydrolase [Clostridiales Family XIII bacterium]